MAQDQPIRIWWRSILDLDPAFLNPGQDLIQNFLSSSALSRISLIGKVARNCQCLCPEISGVKRSKVDVTKST